MNRLDPAVMTGLARLTSLREAEARRNMTEIVSEENAIRIEVRTLEGLGRDPGTGLSDAAANVRWQKWALQRRARLKRDLALVLARKDIAQAALGRATAKNDAMETLRDRSVSDRNRNREARAFEKLLQDDLNSGRQAGD